MQIFLLDNFDSFTFNLKEEFEGQGIQVSVLRNHLSTSEAKNKIMSLKPPRLLVLSPGPGHPREAGCMMSLIEAMEGQVPIFGVCLGMQAMVEHCGGVVGRAKEIVHGKAKSLIHQGEGIFHGLPKRLWVGRYHSLVAQKVPECLQVLAHSGGEVMAVSHKKHPMMGVQFHPESILTTEGSVLIRNVVQWAKDNQL